MILFNKKDFLMNVLVPLIVGLLFYKLSFIPKVLCNYIPDGLWAYGLVSLILIIWQRKINVVWIIMCFIAATLFEYLQKISFINGTADYLDLVVYFIFFSLALLSNKYFKIKFNYA